MRPAALPKELSPAILPGWARKALRGRAKAVVRRAICEATDLIDRAAGRAGPMTPPARLRVRVGCFLSYLRLSRFDAVAAEFAGHLEQLGGLGPQSRVLDVGCGCGQLAIPLAKTLTGGSYEGFDPDREAVEWCATRITARHPHFRFTYADLENSLYNPAGALSASRYRFPYDGGAFDLVVLKSVFTHLQAPALHNYLSEIRRMLVPGGRVIASFFLLTGDAERHIARGDSAMVFPFEGHGCRLMDLETPEYLVAYREQALRTAAVENGLRFDSVAWGSWCGRSDFLSFQDLVVFLRDDDDAQGRPASRAR